MVVMVIGTAAMPKIAPAAPVSTFLEATTPVVGEISINRLVPLGLSVLPTTRSPLTSNALLIGPLSGDPEAMTLADAAEVPENVVPETITPSIPMAETFDSETTRLALVSTTDRKSVVSGKSVDLGGRRII